MHPFQKWYSPTSGEHGELLEGFREQLEERVLKLDALQSRIDRKQQARKKREQPTGCKQNRSRRQRYNTERRLNRKLACDRRRQCGWTESAHYDAETESTLTQFLASLGFQNVLFLYHLVYAKDRKFKLIHKNMQRIKIHLMAQTDE